MSKYLIPFYTPLKIVESNPNCWLCETTDKIFSEIITIINNKKFKDLTVDEKNIIQDKLIILDNELLIDGYSLLDVWEANGYGLTRKDKINEINTYYSNNDLFMSKVNNFFNGDPIINDSYTDMPVLMHSRWCKRCGSRKYDIYEPTRADINKLLEVNNFNAASTYKPIAKIEWEDDHNATNLSNWFKTLLIRKENSDPTSKTDGSLVNSFIGEINLYKDTFYIDDTLLREGDYHYKVFLYDKNDKLLFTHINDIEVTAKSVDSIDYQLFSYIKWFDVGDVDTNNIRQNWFRTILVRKIGNYPANVDDGEFVTEYSDAINKYSVDPYEDTNFIEGNTYYYSAFLFSSFGNLLMTVNISNSTVNYKPKAYIKWTDIDTSLLNKWYKTRLIRKEQSYPINEEDGEVITEYWDTINKYYNETNSPDGPYFYDRNYDLNKNYHYSAFNLDIFNNAISVKHVQNILSDNICNSINLTWEDLDVSYWFTTRLIKKANAIPENDNDGIELKKYSGIQNKNLYKNNPIIDLNLDLGNVYYYQLFFYDIDNNIIKSSDLLDVYIPSGDVIPPIPITNMQSKQIREIDRNEDTNELSIHDRVRITWTNPSDNDFDGVKLQMRNDYIPADENDGKEVFNDKIPQVKLEIGDLSNLDVIHIGDVCYFKIFPYDKIKTRKSNVDVGYYRYRNFNLNSSSNVIQIFDQSNNVSNIKNYPLLNDTTYDPADYSNKIKITWTDPNDDNWVGTKVMYKELSTILGEDDVNAKTVLTTTVRNQYSSTPLVIDNLQDGLMYAVGLFPINRNTNLSNGSTINLCNVNLINQIKANAGAPIPSIIKYDFSDNSYLDKFIYFGKWQVLTNQPYLQTVGMYTGEETICHLVIDRLPLGAKFSFDYKMFSELDKDCFKLYITAINRITNKLECKEIFSINKSCDWTTYEYSLAPVLINENVKISFQYIKNSSNVNSIGYIDNITFTPNTY